MPDLRTMNETTIANLTEMISRLAMAGGSDPDIAARLGLTSRQVATLRNRVGTEPGERRWLGTGQRQTCAESAVDTAEETDHAE